MMMTPMESSITDVQFIKVRQKFEDRKIHNLSETINEELTRIAFNELIQPDMNIGLAVGSRGIQNIDIIIKSIVDEIKRAKGIPFIIPSMGSHGGATAAGQIKVLDKYRINESTIGAQIRSSMEVIELGRLANGLPVYFDKTAMEMDGIIIVNRIKVHTAFKSDIESGLFKMMAIGMGNHLGAGLAHSLGAEGLKDCIVDFAGVIMSKAPIICGLGILENAYDETYKLTAARPAEIEYVDKTLLNECKLLMPNLPIHDLDILVVEEIGKNISGTGMDTNVVGGIMAFNERDYFPPLIKKIIVLDLSDETQGNAMGVGMAHLITQRAYNKIDFKDTYENAITSTFLDRVRIPIVAQSDRKAMDIALKTIWNYPDTKPRIIIIKNTLQLHEMYVSEAVWTLIKTKPDIETIGPWKKLAFNQEGNLLSE